MAECYNIVYISGAPELSGDKVCYVQKKLYER